MKLTFDVTMFFDGVKSELSWSKISETELINIGRFFTAKPGEPPVTLTFRVLYEGASITGLPAENHIRKRKVAVKAKKEKAP